MPGYAPGVCWGSLRTGTKAKQQATQHHGTDYLAEEKMKLSTFDALDHGWVNLLPLLTCTPPKKKKALLTPY